MMISNIKCVLIFKSNLMSNYLQTTVKLPNGWDQVWKDGNISWDKGQSAPALNSLLTHPLLPQSGNVLIPG